MPAFNRSTADYSPWSTAAPVLPDDHSAEDSPPPQRDAHASAPLTREPLTSPAEEHAPTTADGTPARYH